MDIPWTIYLNIVYSSDFIVQPKLTLCELANKTKVYWSRSILVLTIPAITTATTASPIGV